MSIINYLKKSIKKKFTSLTNKLIKEYYMPQQIITGNSGQVNTIGNVGDIYPIGTWADGADTLIYTNTNSARSQATMGAGLSLPNTGLHTTIESTPQGISENIISFETADGPVRCHPDLRADIGHTGTGLRGSPSLRGLSQYEKNGGFINKGRIFNFKH